MNFLRNGGNAFELQMVQTPGTGAGRSFDKLRTGLDAAHRKASPVENWRL